MILPIPQKERSRTQPQPYDASHYQTHEKYLFSVTAFLEYEYPEQYGEYRAQTCPYGIGYPQWKSLCRCRQQEYTQSRYQHRQYCKFLILEAI